jgi:MFS family permease
VANQLDEGASETEAAGRKAAGRKSIAYQRNFLLFVGGQTLSRVGNGAYTVGLAWTVYAITGSPRAMGALLAINAIPELAFLMLGGAISDRLPRRVVILACDSAAGVVLLVLTMFAASRNLTPVTLYAAAGVLGIVSAFYGPAYSAMNRSLLRTEELRAGNSIITVCGNAARLVGPPLAAVLYAAWGPKAVFGLDSLSFFVAVIAMALTKVAADGHRSHTGVIAQVRNGLRYTLGTRWLKAVIGVSMVANIACLAPFFVLLADLVREQGHGIHLLGWLTSTQVAATIVASIAVGNSRWRLKRPSLSLVVLASVMGLGSVILGLSSRLLPLLFVGAALIGFGFSFDIIENTLIQALVPKGMLSRVYSIDSVVSFALLPMGYAIAGVCAAVAGPAPVFAVGGSALIGACVLTAAGRYLSDVDNAGVSL